MSTTRLIVLAQYDPNQGLPAHVRIHLERLRPHATRLVLVSNSTLDSASYELANRLCDRVLVRDNTGWDFAAWRDVLATETEDDWDSIILTNSSIVGPFFPIDPVIQEMEAGSADFWGLVHSKQMGSHLQSFFLGFSNQVVRSPAWKDFWKNVEILEDKWEVIKSYEIGLTNHFTKAGFKFDAYMKNPSFPKSIRMVEIERAGRALRVPWDINRAGRTILDHKTMIEEGMPYIKASLLWGKHQHRMCSITEIMDLEKVDYPWEELGLAAEFENVNGRV